ncbi:hypothetical protein A2Z67_00095 [Candidatus Woesebacteria bacterium RBG_13_36_22]|uniref:DUF2158 domain-containing protein n=1 Tax=Candidatus Woesebacteria bacterium RBG_13_36_22 TaxID=1802478 RepID=A0A1F7X6N1_9BACT|nr:MAG: hypothetical protein A2Z67_00095 [Candidatus Woesebacteria bacterium RBG_13_36_22]
MSLHLTPGDLVYRAFRPQKPGKVISVVSERLYFNMVSVIWINGETEILSEDSLQNFRELIADHERKLATHRNKLPKLERL